MITSTRSSPSLQTWLLAARPFSFTASAIPALLGGVIALWMRAAGLVMFDFSILNFILTALGCVLIHAVSNLVNDYFDFKTGLDAADNFGSVNPLVRQTLSLGQMRAFIASCFGLAFAIGVYLIWDAGDKAMPLVYLVVIGAVSAYFYTAPPFSLKYRGLGDVQVMLSFAFLMVFGAYYVQAKMVSWLPVWYSLPVALLVDDILHINNLRDMPADAKAGINTLALRLGESGAKTLHDVFVYGAYLSVAGLIAFAHLTWFGLLVLLSLPAALKLSKEVHALTQPNVDLMLVPRAAQFHALFGLLMIVGFILGIFIKF